MSGRVAWLIEWPTLDGAVWLRPGGGFTIFAYEGQQFQTRKAAEQRLAKLDWPGAFVSEHAWGDPEDVDYYTEDDDQ